MQLNCGICTLRSWQNGDEESLPRHANNRQIWLNMRDRFPHPYTRADAESWIRQVRQQKPETSFAIDIKGEAVGGIGLVLHDDVERCSAEVGYWLGEDFWGRGIMTAVLRELTDYAFKEFNLARIYAVPYARNASSVKVLEKAGFVLEGVLRRSAIKDGVILDQLMYARTDE
jgi:RimJ/RimL family protein N-acetyltransferase